MIKEKELGAILYGVLAMIFENKKYDPYTGIYTVMGIPIDMDREDFAYFCRGMAEIGKIGLTRRQEEIVVEILGTIYDSLRYDDREKWFVSGKFLIEMDRGAMMVLARAISALRLIAYKMENYSYEVDVSNKRRYQSADLGCQNCKGNFEGSKNIANAWPNQDGWIEYDLNCPYCGHVQHVVSEAKLKPRWRNAA